MRLIAPTASREEAAAVVAAIERFVRDTARPPARRSDADAAWRTAALREGVERERASELRDPWIAE